jgi:hypothetical protein
MHDVIPPLIGAETFTNTYKCIQSYTKTPLQHLYPSLILLTKLQVHKMWERAQKPLKREPPP